MTLMHAPGLLASSLLAVTITLMLMNTRRYRPPTRITLFAILLVVMVIPIDGLVVAGYVRGIVGDPSVTTVILLAGALFNQLTNRPTFDAGSVTAVMGLVLVAGAWLYPMTLGLTAFDPYAAGYGSPVLFGALLGVTLVAWQRNWMLVVACILGGVAAHLLGVYESPNLWDCLTDAMVTVFAIVWLLFVIIMRMFRARRATPAEAA